MSIAPGYQGTNTIMQELEARMGKIESDPRFIVFGPGQPDPKQDEEAIAAWLAKHNLKPGRGFRTQMLWQSKQNLHVTMLRKLSRQMV